MGIRRIALGRRTIADLECRRRRHRSGEGDRKDPLDQWQGTVGLLRCHSLRLPRQALQRAQHPVLAATHAMPDSDLGRRKLQAHAAARRRTLPGLDAAGGSGRDVRDYAHASAWDAGTAESQRAGDQAQRGRAQRDSRLRDGLLGPVDHKAGQRDRAASRGARAFRSSRLHVADREPPERAAGGDPRVHRGVRGDVHPRLNPKKSPRSP